MLKTIFKHRHFPFFIQYASSLASGSVTFFSFLAFRRFLPTEEIFSQVSAIVLLFSSYQVFLDLGTHNELTRVLSGKTPLEALPYLKTIFLMRMAYVFAGIILVFAHAALASYSPEARNSLALFVAAFIPFCVFATFDSAAMALGKSALAITVKLARVGGMAVLVAAALVTGGKSIIELFWAYLIAMIIAASPFVYLFGRKILLAQKNAIQSEIESIPIFIKNTLATGTLQLIVAAHGMGGIILLTRLLGEKNITNFSIGTALATPGILALQTLTSLRLVHIAAHVRQGWPHREVKRQIQLLSGMGILCCVAIFVVEKFGIHGFLFPNATSDVVLVSGLFLVAQTLVQVGWTMGSVLQFKGYRYLVSFIYGGSLALLIPFFFYQVQERGIVGFAWAQSLFSLVFFCLALIFYLKKSTLRT